MDQLNMDRINGLPHPLIARMLVGDEWEINDICVESGMMRVIVCGLLQVMWFSDARCSIDGEGVSHDIDCFYLDYEEGDDA